MKQKKLRVLVENEFAKALAAEKARVDKENAFRLGRFCVENHITISVDNRLYVIGADIDDRLGYPGYELSLARKFPGHLDWLYHLDNDYVIEFILTHKDAIYEEYERLCEHLGYLEIVEGKDVIYPDFPSMVKEAEIRKQDIRKEVINLNKHIWAAPVHKHVWATPTHAPKGKHKHHKVIFETEEYEVLPALNGSKSLLEGRNAIGNLYESNKWEMGAKRTHVAPRSYKVKRRATRRAIRKLTEVVIYVEEDEE